MAISKGLTAMADQNKPTTTPPSGAAGTQPNTATQAATGGATATSKNPQAESGTNVGPKVAAPTSAAPTGAAPIHGKNYELFYRDQSVVKINLADGVNVTQLWQQFRSEHSHITDPKGLTGAFVGDLVNKYGGTQLDKSTTGAQRIDLR